jgi:hypothetical protein
VALSLDLILADFEGVGWCTVHSNDGKESDTLPGNFAPRGFRPGRRRRAGRVGLSPEPSKSRVEQRTTERLMHSCGKGADAVNVRVSPSFIFSPFRNSFRRPLSPSSAFLREDRQASPEITVKAPASFF